jgi:predicted transcriptional regulator
MNSGKLILDRQLSAEIVGAYLRNNQLAADQVGSLISIVHQALADLDKPAAEMAVRTPAVPIRRSVTRDFVVCVECGWKGSVVRRHLTAAHGLTVDEYRARWNLPADHAMTAPAYSERRSTMAKQIGLGRGRSAARSAVSEPEKATSPAPKQRGRPRSAATPA